MDDAVWDLLAELGTEDWKDGGVWRGCQVLVPVYKGNPIIGLPYVLLKDADGWRISDEEESLAYLNDTVK